MAAYEIKQHFKGLRVETGRRKGRRDPFATGFSEDDSEEETKRSRTRKRSDSLNTKQPAAPPIARPQALGPAAKTSILDQLIDSSDDEFLAPSDRTDRRPSPAPAKLARLTGRRGSIDTGLQTSNRAPRSAIAQAAGTLAYLDDSEDDGALTSPRRTDRRPSPAPSKESDSVDPLQRSSTPRGSREPPKEQSQTRLQPSRHTVASPFAGTKYLQDSSSDSEEEAVSSRQGSADNNAISPSEVATSDPLSPYESALSPTHLEVKRVDKSKNGTGMSWRAFSTSRSEQRNTELEALQASLKQRGKSISFGTHAVTDDGKRVPIPVAPQQQGLSAGAVGRAKGRGKSPPRRASETEPGEDDVEYEGGRVGLYDPREFKTNPFSGT